MRQLSLTSTVTSDVLDLTPFGKNKKQAVAGEDVLPGAKAENLVATNGLIEYKYTPRKDTTAESKSTIAMLEKMKPMLGDMPMTITYNLPRPVKNVTTNSKSVLSADKKRVSITYNLLDIMKDPSLQAYKIEY